MADPVRFEYASAHTQSGYPDLLPQLPLILTYKNQSVEISGLLDTGATTNVLSHSVGLQLGAEWDPQAPAITLAGNLALFPAQPIVVVASIVNFRRLV